MVRYALRNFPKNLRTVGVCPSAVNTSLSICRVVFSAFMISNFVSAYVRRCLRSRALVDDEVRGGAVRARGRVYSGYFMCERPCVRSRLCTEAVCTAGALEFTIIMHNAFIWQILFAVAFFVSIFDVRPVMRMVANFIQVNASTPQIVKSNVLSLIACETHARQIEVKVQIKRATQSVHACGVERADAWAIEKLMVRGFTSTLSQKSLRKTNVLRCNHRAHFQINAASICFPTLAPHARIGVAEQRACIGAPIGVFRAKLRWRFSAPQLVFSIVF